MEAKKTKECPRNSVLDYNLSWGLMLVYLGYLLGIWFAQQTSKDYIPSGYSGAPYFLVSIILGVVLTFLVYNLGKILFAKVAGYRVAYMKILGFLIDKSEGKAKVRYDILSFFDLSLQFTPKDDDVNKNPKLIFLGGFIAEFVLIVISLILFFVLGLNQVKTTQSAIGWTALFMMSYGFLTPLYEILPFRQDFPTDMFNLLVTSKPEDKIAFNVCMINKKNEHAGLDYVSHEFEDYNSFYRARVLHANYLDHLYSSRLEKAFTTIDTMRYYNKFFNDADRYVPYGEIIYLHFSIDDDKGADSTFLSMKKDDKKIVAMPELISDYRTALLIAAFIASDSEKVKDIVNRFNQLMKSYEGKESKRLSKEKEFFAASLEKIKKNKPELHLSEEK